LVWGHSVSKGFSKRKGVGTTGEKNGQNCPLQGRGGGGKTRGIHKNSPKKAEVRQEKNRNKGGEKRIPPITPIPQKCSSRRNRLKRDDPKAGGGGIESQNGKGNRLLVAWG